jgi:hypothetical protein
MGDGNAQIAVIRQRRCEWSKQPRLTADIDEVRAPPRPARMEMALGGALAPVHLQLSAAPE